MNSSLRFFATTKLINQGKTISKINNNSTKSRSITNSIPTLNSDSNPNPNPNPNPQPNLINRIISIPHPSKMSSQSAKVLKSYPLEDKDAKWVSLRAIEWKDPEGKERKWECADRRTRKGDVDAVAICTIIERPSSQPHILLVSQFRPPVGKSVIEMPAGLVDKGEEGKEGIQKAALRELNEETGYGKSSGHEIEIIEISNIMFSDPGLQSSNMSLCIFKIQLSDDSPDPVAKPDEGEFIEKHLVPLKDLMNSLKEFQKQGYEVDARLAHMAVGVQLGSGAFGVKL